MFAVGDRKQSIFAFQGADPDGFDDWRDRLRRRVQDAGENFAEVALDVSFRSTAPVLALVDAVFADPEAAAGRVRARATLRHLADRAGHAGSVELWPLAPAPDAEPPEPWHGAGAQPARAAAPQRLAEALAEWIARADRRRRCCWKAAGGRWRPGDVLVLVRRRNAFARALVRALKARGVPVAGLDRMVLTEQPAVQDLLALADALLLPQDDLAFACVLTSPLGGLDDDALMDLAVGPRRRAVGRAARAARDERPDWARGLDVLRARCSRASITSRRTRCSPRRWGRSAGGRGCSRGWARRRRSRSTNC